MVGVANEVVAGDGGGVENGLELDVAGDDRAALPESEVGEGAARLGDGVEVVELAVVLGGELAEALVVEVAGAHADDGNAEVAVRRREIERIAVGLGAVTREDDVDLLARAPLAEQIVGEALAGEVEDELAGAQAGDRGVDHRALGERGRGEDELFVVGEANDGDAVVAGGGEAVEQAGEALLEQGQAIGGAHRVRDVEDDDDETVVKKGEAGLDA